MTIHHDHNSPYLYVRLKRIRRHKVVVGFNVHAKAGRLWWKVAHFEEENDAIDKLVDIAESIR